MSVNVSPISKVALPDGWQERKIINSCLQIMDFRGRTPRKLGMAWGGGEIAALSAGNVKMGYIDFSAECYLGSEELHDRWMTKGPVAKNDVLFTTEAPLGNVALVPDDKKYILSQRTISLRGKPGVALNEYLFQFLRSQNFQDILSGFASGSTAKGIQRRQFEQIKITLPPEEEQRAIAKALSDVDALLEGLDQLIAKKRDIKQAAMQQLLTGRTRLPGFEGEWEVKTVGDIAEVKTGPFGSTLHESDYVAAGTPIITVEHLGEFGVVHINLPLVSDIDRRRLSAYSLEVGDIVFSRVGSVDRNALIREPEEGWLFSGRLLRVRPHRNVTNPEFLSFQFHSEEFLSTVLSVAVGQTMASLNTSILRDIPVALPPLDEQREIAAILSEIDGEIGALEHRRTKTANLKQAMMQELLTGRTRLVGPAAEQPPATNKAPQERKANVYFKRSVLAAEIVDQLHEQPTFGHVKFEKLLFLTEHVCHIDTGSTYHRKAAGPYDNRALRSIDSQLGKLKWFVARKVDGRYRYEPLARRGGHRHYFDRYFAEQRSTFQRVIDTFREATTEQCEIVATLYSAWSDLLRDQPAVSDERIVDEVLNHWHEDKKRIPPESWHAALGWMREKGFVPDNAVPP